MTCGIYLLEFNNTDKVYVGLSSDIERRFLEHKSSFNRGIASKKLYDAYTTYGMPKLKIIFECEESELFKLEQEAIEVFNSIENGFNTTKADGPCRTILVGEDAPGAIHSNEQIEEVFFYLIKNIETQQTISYLTGVSPTIISNIFMGKKHLWLKDKYTEQYLELMKLSSLSNNNSKSKIIEIFNLLLDSNLTHKEIAKLVNVSEGVVGNVSSGARYKWLKDLFPDKYTTLINMKGNRQLKRKVYLINKDIIEPVVNITTFCNKYNISTSGISELINGKVKCSNGWSLYDNNET